MENFWRRWRREYLLQLRSVHLCRAATSSDLQLLLSVTGYQINVPAPDPAYLFSPPVLHACADVAAVSFLAPTSSTTAHAPPTAPSPIRAATQPNLFSGFGSANWGMSTHPFLIIPQLLLSVTGYQINVPAPDPAYLFSPPVLHACADVAAVSFLAPTSSTTAHAPPTAPSPLRAATQPNLFSGFGSANWGMSTHPFLIIPQPEKRDEGKRAANSFVSLDLIASAIVAELKEAGSVADSTSKYANPILIVRKKTGERRLCVDYHALSRQTKNDRYPHPLIDDLLDCLRGMCFFTSLDLASGYYQIPMSEEWRHKTESVTPDGHYEFVRMPFGFENAPAGFQRMINAVL
ncbi:uncharacterized protein ISCGN_016568 [Ixodes scapularis]